MAVLLIPEGFARMPDLPSGPLSVVELGTGNGLSTTAVLAEVLHNGRPRQNSTILGVDLSPKMIAEASKQKYPGVDARFVAGDALVHLERSASASQDVVVSLGVIPWHLELSEMPALYSEALRVLKPGGYVLHDVLSQDLDSVRALAASAGFQVETIAERLGFLGYGARPPAVVLQKPTRPADAEARPGAVR